MEKSLRLIIETDLDDALWFLRTNDSSELDNMRRAIQEALELANQLINMEKDNA